MKTRTGSIVKRKPRRKGAKATWWARVTYIDPKTGKRQLKVLRDYFGSCRLRSITHGDVRQFRTARLAQETRTKTQRTIASVNRELSMRRCRGFTICATRQPRDSWARIFRYRKPVASGAISQANTTYRYVNANVETAKRAAAALDVFNAETMETVTAAELVH